MEEKSNVQNMQPLAIWPLTDILVIPTGRWGAYYAGIRLYEKYQQILQDNGVYRYPDGYDDVAIFWVQGDDVDELEKRIKYVGEFVKKHISQMYIV